MNILLLLVVLLLLFGGGGFYIGGPVLGGSGLGLTLLICLVVYLAGGFPRRKADRRAVVMSSRHPDGFDKASQLIVPGATWTGLAEFFPGRCETGIGPFLTIYLAAKGWKEQKRGHHRWRHRRHSEPDARRRAGFYRLHAKRALFQGVAAFFAFACKAPWPVA